MTIVYVTQDVQVGGPVGKVPRFDITPAAEYGEIRYLLDAKASAFCIAPISRQLREGLKNFSDSDILLPVGDPAIMLMAGIIAAQRTGGKLTILKWDRHSRRYLKVRFEL